MSVRVLHVAEAYGGGLLEVVVQLAAGAARSGGSAAIAYGQRPETPADPGAGLPEGVGAIYLGWRRARPWTHAAVARRLRRLVVTWQPDVVHLHSSFAGVVGTLALHGRVPLVYTPHSFASSAQGTSATRRALFRAAERAAVRRASLVGAVSTSEADAARALGASRVVTVPNGISELDEATEAPGTVQLPARVIAAGRVVEQRQPLACARILAGVRDVAEVAWIGGGGHQGQWGDRAVRALTEAGAAPTGWLAREQMLAELRRATIYLHWTDWDGQALSALEAMACDAIVVASDIAPNRELLDPRQLATDEASAIALIRRVLSDRGLATDLLARQAEQRVAHSARRMTERWLEVYDELLRTAA